MPQDGVLAEAVFLRLTLEYFNIDFAIRQICDSLAALLKGLADRRPDGKPRGLNLRFVFEAKRQRGAFAMRQNGSEQIQFLRRHFGETVKPQILDLASGVWRPGIFAQRVGGAIEQAVRIFQLMFSQPVRTSIEQQGKVVEFVLKLAAFRKVGSEGAKFGGGELMLLQFTEQPAELLGETGPAGAPAEQLQFVLMPHQQRA